MFGNLIESTDERRHSIFGWLGVGCLRRRMVTRCEIGGAVAEVVDGWHTVEQFVLRFGQLQCHLLRER